MCASTSALAAAPTNSPCAASATTSLGTGMAQRRGGAEHGLAAGDEVVEQQHGGAFHVAGHQVAAAHQAQAAPLVDHGKVHRPRQPRFECLAPQQRALHAAGVGRGHGQRAFAGQFGHQRVEGAVRLQVQRRAAEGVLERGHVVRLQHHHLVGAHGLEQLRHVAQRHRVQRLGLAVLARIGQVGHDGGDARRTVLAQRGHEQQQPAQLVVRAVLRAAVQAAHHVGVVAARVHQRPQLVFAVLEAAVLVARQGFVQRCRQRGGEPAFGVETEEQHAGTLPCCSAAAAPAPDDLHRAPGPPCGEPAALPQRRPLHP